jgi:hypothetical protein
VVGLHGCWACGVAVEAGTTKWSAVLVPNIIMVPSCCSRQLWSCMSKHLLVYPGQLQWPARHKPLHEAIALWPSLSQLSTQLTMTLLLPLALLACYCYSAGYNTVPVPNITSVSGCITSSSASLWLWFGHLQSQLQFVGAAFEQLLLL